MSTRGLMWYKNFAHSCWSMLEVFRIQTVRPDRFLTETVESMLSAIRDIAGLDLLPLQEQDGPHLGGAIELIHACAEFVDTLTSHEWIDKARDSCVQSLQHYVLTAIALLHAHASNDLASQFHLRVEPRYKMRSGKSATTAPDEAWRAIMAASSDIQLDARALYQLATTRNGDLTIVGALALLAHVIAESPESVNLGTSHSPVGALQELYPGIIAGITGRLGLTTGEDEPLFVAWWLIDGAVKRREAIDDELIFVLVEYLGAISSHSQVSNIRFAAFRLLTYMLKELVQREEILLMILKDLVCDCPFEPMQVASITLVRELVLHKMDQKQNSILLSPLFRLELATPMFDGSATKFLTDPSLELERFVDMYLRIVMEKLSILYLLLARDERDLTQTKANFASTKATFVDPLRQLMGTWLNQEGLSMSHVLDLEMLKASLDRVDSILERT
ncbi:hypothetical protein OIO90_001446 [Microbotryomycetes sp. JL221]|nr:hypothetical protein OIO90_001446 [Microbotryomycetes sp. JL221]